MSRLLPCHLDLREQHLAVAVSSPKKPVNHRRRGLQSTLLVCTISYLIRIPAPHKHALRDPTTRQPVSQRSPKCSQFGSRTDYDPESPALLSLRGYLTQNPTWEFLYIGGLSCWCTCNGEAHHLKLVFEMECLVFGSFQMNVHYGVGSVAPES